VTSSEPAVTWPDDPTARLALEYSLPRWLAAAMIDQVTRHLTLVDRDFSSKAEYGREYFIIDDVGDVDTKCDATRPVD
jgi:hypothetical protein